MLTFQNVAEYASAVLLPERFRGRLAPSAVGLPPHSPALTPRLPLTTHPSCGMRREESTAKTGECGDFAALRRKALIW